jgi:hypothetical protein
MNNNYIWYGLAKNGSQIRIDHEKLMSWAYDNDMQYQIGWSRAVTMPDGSRIARTKEAALEKGWIDVAKAPFE